MHPSASRSPAVWVGFRLLLCLWASAVAAGPPGDASPVYREGELLVRFVPEARAQVLAPRAARGLTLRRRLAREVELVQLPPGLTVAQALEQLRADPLVEHAEPNYLVRRAGGSDTDVHFDQQWYLQTIRAQEAWELAGSGSRDIVVAVLDSGIDYQHPELKPNIWKNPAPGTAEECAAADAPQPCYVDDVRGWNFVGAWDSELRQRVPNNDPMDDDSGSHGTHVAGLIGAVGEAMYGVSPRVSLMPLKFLDSAGSGSIADMLAAIDYAVDNGAHIINASFTIPTRCQQVSTQFGLEAIARAAERDVLVVAAAGNGGCDNAVTPFYPASLPLPNVIAVAAINGDDGLAGFSNHGVGSVHLAAPGTGIVSTVHRDLQTSETKENGPYATLSGTSMAAPLVAGALALLQVHRPELGFLERREVLLQSVREVEGLAGRVLTGGALDVEAALRFDLATAKPLPPSHLRASRHSEHRIELAWVDSLLASGYRVERRDGADFQAVAQLQAPSARFIDDSVDALPGSRLVYRVHAGNERGESAAEVEMAVPLPAPHDLRAEVVPGAGVRLRWAYPPARHDGFEVQRRAAGAQRYEAIALVEAAEYRDVAPGSAGEYSYRVRALSAAVGPSWYSPVLTVSLTEAEPANEDTLTVERARKCVLSSLLAGTAAGDRALADLRRLRDDRLLPNPLGRQLVRAYYRLGTPVAEWLDHRPVFRDRLALLLQPLR